jgi:hypothetical protein
MKASDQTDMGSQHVQPAYNVQGCQVGCEGSLLAPERVLMILSFTHSCNVSATHENKKTLCFVTGRWINDTRITENRTLPPRKNR